MWTSIRSGCEAALANERGRAIEAEGLRFRYSSRAEPTLRGIDLAQSLGEMVVLSGPSGAGKTTLTQCLNRIIPTYHPGQLEGAIRLLGKPLPAGEINELTGVIGLVFQEFEAQIFSSSVELEVAFGPSNLGVEREELLRRVRESLERVGLAGLERRDPQTLSGGQKQRLAIASLLALRPQILVMDEATTDLDPAGKEEIFGVARALADEGMALLLVDHTASRLRSADRLALMAEGQIVATGEPDGLLRDAAVMARAGLPVNEIAMLGREIGMSALPLDPAAAYQALRKAGWRVEQSLAVESQPAGEPGGAPACGEVMVGAKGVRFAYPGGLEALRGVDLQIREGDFVAVLGENGSGKSTLCLLLIGLLGAQEGECVVQGRATRQLAKPEIGRVVGYVHQNPDVQLYAATVEEEVAFAAENLGFGEAEVTVAVGEALEATGLQGERKSNPFTLSRGERERVAVASVLAARPKVVILDEPTTGLDWVEQERVMGVLQEVNGRGTAVVIVTHSIPLAARYARRCVVLSRGELVADAPPREVLTDTGLLARAALRAPDITQLGSLLGVQALTARELASVLRRQT